jgi:hypothetical protein
MLSTQQGSDTDDKAGDSDCSVGFKSVTKARNARPTGKRAKLGTRVVKPNPIKLRKNSGGKSTFSVESVMLAFNDKTEFGISFRGMNVDQQKSEVDTLNKGAATGLKGVMKKNRIQVQFRTLVTDKMRDYLVANRTDTCNMFRTIRDGYSSCY